MLHGKQLDIYFKLTFKCTDMVLTYTEGSRIDTSCNVSFTVWANLGESDNPARS